MDSSANGQLKLDGNAYSAAFALNASGLNIYHNSNSRSIIFGTNETERLRIAADGKIGIGGAPAYTLDLGESSSTIRLVSESNGTAIRMGAGGTGNDFTLLRVDGTTSNHDGESDDSAHGFSLKYMGSRSGTANSLSLFSDNESATAIEAITVEQDGKIGINNTNPSATLDVIGSIKKTVYQPGEIIEQLETQADGNDVTVQSGTYTTTNVTAIQNCTTSHVTINGSSFDYTPPTGTTRLIYEFWVYMRDTDVGPLLHFQGRVDGTVVNNSRHTWRGSTASADYQQWIYSKMILRVGVSESLSAGDVGTWTSAKTIDFTAREYSSTYEGRFHKTNHWNGAGTDIVVKPRIRITAIA